MQTNWVLQHWFNIRVNPAIYLRCCGGPAADVECPVEERQDLVQVQVAIAWGLRRGRRRRLSPVQWLRRGSGQRREIPRRQRTLSGSHSALPLRPGVLSSLLSYWARTTCHVTYSLDRDAPRPGQPTSSRHYGVGPTTTVGATIRVTEPPPYQSALWLRLALPVTAGSDGGSQG